MSKPISTNIRVFPLRLPANSNVFEQVRKLIKDADLHSVFIMTCVGSVQSCRLRLADSTGTMDLNENHEIVSLVGTFDSEGGHIHGSFSDKKGRVIGGHLMSDIPMIVYTTVEIVLAECIDVKFSRQFDEETGYPELVIERKLFV